MWIFASKLYMKLFSRCSTKETKKKTTPISNKTETFCNFLHTYYHKKNWFSTNYHKHSFQLIYIVIIENQRESCVHLLCNSSILTCDSVSCDVNASISSLLERSAESVWLSVSSSTSPFIFTSLPSPLDLSSTESERQDVSLHHKTLNRLTCTGKYHLPVLTGK